MDARNRLGYGGFVRSGRLDVSHVAFAAVDRFHAAALQAGGTDNGAPRGVRETYHLHLHP